MSLRKQAVQDASFVPSETESIDENTQELEVVVDDDDDDDGDAKFLSSLFFSEMTEEEMMDLALRMSEQEASDDAFRLQQEEAAVMKAIEESVSTNLSSCHNLDLLSNHSSGSALDPNSRGGRGRRPSSGCHLTRTRPEVSRRPKKPKNG
uniref:BRCA1-A complex subunit RAP80 n=1 Tax=Scophthalmus maximus TaxID=52904 RepID=A0A8D3EA56_SCOMX